MLLRDLLRRRSKGDSKSMPVLCLDMESCRDDSSELISPAVKLSDLKGDFRPSGSPNRKKSSSAVCRKGIIRKSIKEDVFRRVDSSGPFKSRVNSSIAKSYHPPCRVRAMEWKVSACKLRTRSDSEPVEESIGPIFVKRTNREHSQTSINRAGHKAPSNDFQESISNAIDFCDKNSDNYVNTTQCPETCMEFPSDLPAVLSHLSTPRGRLPDRCDFRLSSVRSVNFFHDIWDAMEDTFNETAKSYMTTPEIVLANDYFRDSNSSGNDVFVLVKGISEAERVTGIRARLAADSNISLASVYSSCRHNVLTLVTPAKVSSPHLRAPHWTFIGLLAIEALLCHKIFPSNHEHSSVLLEWRRNFELYCFQILSASCQDYLSLREIMVLRKFFDADELM